MTANNANQSMQADRTLDARGLNCPQPILQTRQLMKKLPPGSTLLVLATDPGSVLDFQAYCRITKTELLNMLEGEDEFHFLMRKAT
jgi:tRNA 2-thiouridine synthesizing protein A